MKHLQVGTWARDYFHSHNPILKVYRFFICTLRDNLVSNISLCTVNIYSRIYSNETQVETAEFCRSPQHAHSTHSAVNHIPFLQRTLRYFILTFRHDQPRGRCLGTGKHSKKNKTLWIELFFPPDWILRGQRMAAFLSMMRVIQIILTQLEMAWWGSNCWAPCWT